jgi:hypothetical protein
VSKEFKIPQYTPSQLNSNIACGLTKENNISKDELDSVQWLCESYKHQIKQIADLEAKLAEKDDRINWLVEAEFNRKWAKKYVEMRRKEDPMLCLPDSDEVYERYFELKQQLAEKDAELEEVKQHRTQILNFGKRTKKVVIANPYGEDCVVYNQENQDKISFAVEKLVGVQKYISDNAVYVEEESFGREINDYIDNQIKRLTHQHEDKGE